MWALVGQEEAPPPCSKRAGSWRRGLPEQGGTKCHQPRPQGGGTSAWLSFPENKQRSVFGETKAEDLPKLKTQDSACVAGGPRGAQGTADRDSAPVVHSREPSSPLPQAALGSHGPPLLRPRLWPRPPASPTPPHLLQPGCSFRVKPGYHLIFQFVFLGDGFLECNKEAIGILVPSQGSRSLDGLGKCLRSACPDWLMRLLSLSLLRSLLLSEAA